MLRLIFLSSACLNNNFLAIESWFILLIFCKRLFNFECQIQIILNQSKLWVSQAKVPKMKVILYRLNFVLVH
jgi:hypothetical protein